MHSDYSFQCENLYYKHEISRNLPKDAYSMHSHNMYELLFFISGDATYIIEDRKYKLKRGDLIIIKPSKYHFIQIDSDCDYERYDILFGTKTKSINSIFLLDNAPELINLEEYHMATDIIKKCDFYCKHFANADLEAIIAGLLSELFYLLSVTPATENTDAPKVTSPILSRAINYINENLTTVTDIAEVAKSCFITESYLFRLFRKELYQSPKRYITSKRLLLAERLIAEGERPSAVFERCGFTDYTTFYRNYVAFFGCSPSAHISETNK